MKWWIKVICCLKLTKASLCILIWWRFDNFDNSNFQTFCFLKLCPFFVLFTKYNIPRSIFRFSLKSNYFWVYNIDNLILFKLSKKLLQLTFFSLSSLIAITAWNRFAYRTNPLPMDTPFGPGWGRSLNCKISPKGLKLELLKKWVAKTQSSFCKH